MSNPYKILLVEDEPKLNQVIKEEFERHNYKIDIAKDGLLAEQLFNDNAYSLVILDINVPYKNGLELCKEFRRINKKIPIIILSALGEINDKVDAFTLGADDYMVKPFHFDELFARIKVFLKRSEGSIDETEKLVIGDLVIDLAIKTVTRKGDLIPLTAKEFALLHLLAKNKGKVISKQEIMTKVWDVSFDTGTNTIEVYISFLRNKLDRAYEDKLIHTKPGFGYYIK